MPRYTGSQLSSLMQKFGLPNWGAGNSRWTYMDDLLRYTIQESTTSDLLVYLFAFEQFRSRLSELDTTKKMEDAHTKITQTGILEINKHLIFNKKELR